MTKKPAIKTQPKKNSKAAPKFSQIHVDRRNEWRLELPLSILVEGMLPKGKKFAERTLIQNISSGGAYFCLDSGITVGSKLKLVIDLPGDLTEGKPTKLSLGGLTVRLEKINKKGKNQGIALRFDEEFEFISENKKK